MMRVVALRRAPKVPLLRGSSSATTMTRRAYCAAAISTNGSSHQQYHTKKQQHRRQHETTYDSSSASFLGSLPSDPCSFGTLSSSLKSQQQQHFGSTSTCSVRWHSTAVDDSTMHSSSIPFLLADIGEGIAEVELLQWFVQEGDHVNQFDRICEVQSDKATVEITSRYDGFITSLDHSVGDMVKVGSPLLFLQSDDDAATDDGGSTNSNHLHHQGAQGGASVDHHDSEPLLNIPTIASQYHLQTDKNDGGDSTSTAATATSTSGDIIPPDDVRHKVQTSPAIRKIAKEYNLDLSTIIGTGPQGRVLKGDVLTVLRERGLMARAERSSSSPQQASSSSFVEADPFLDREKSEDASSSATPAATTVKDINEVAGTPLTQDTILEIRGYNRLMVQSMTASLQIPHMVFADEIQVDAILKHKLPFLPLAVKAMSQALIQYPLLNSSFVQSSEDGCSSSKILLRKEHNVGIAMDTPRGLIVPVVKNCQTKSISDIVDDLQRLKELAREGTVPAEDLTGATITLSNIGAIGAGTYMSPIVTAPQVAIGAIGKIQRVPRFVEDSTTSMEVEEVRVCNVSWGGDHRVIDGATMARFHKQWKDYLEDPMTLIQDLK